MEETQTDIKANKNRADDRPIRWKERGKSWRKKRGRYRGRLDKAWARRAGGYFGNKRSEEKARGIDETADERKRKIRPCILRKSGEIGVQIVIYEYLFVWEIKARKISDFDEIRGLTKWKGERREMDKTGERKRLLTRRGGKKKAMKKEVAVDGCIK